MTDDAPDPRFFNVTENIKIGHNRLPHWDQQGCCYFITFRLFDSIPAPLMAELRAEETEWLAAHPKPWTPEIEADYLQTFQGKIERWLDEGHGECLLGEPGFAEIVATALAFHESTRTRLHAWVIMPNHVHVLAEICEGWDLAQILKSWKGFTATEINRRNGRTGPLWQKGYFDRLIRNWEHFGNVVRYIRRNPMKAKLPSGQYMHGESALAVKL